MDAPTSARSLTGLAFDRLRAEILAGQLRPGLRLKIQGLSERYGVGATAIREALSRLVTDGLVELEELRGFAVAPVSRADLMDLTRTRVELESIALRTAIEQGDVEWEGEVLGSFHRLSRTRPPVNEDSHAAWAAAHRQFHETLVAGCKSPWLIRLCRMLYDKSERYRNLAENKTASGQRDTIEEHRALVDAVAIERQPQRALKLIKDHFWTTTNIILDSGFTDGPRRGGPATKAPVT